MRKSVPQTSDFVYDVRSKMQHLPVPGTFSVYPIYSTPAALHAAAVAAGPQSFIVDPRACVSTGTAFDLAAAGALVPETATAAVTTPAKAGASPYSVGATFVKALPLPKALQERNVIVTAQLDATHLGELLPAATATSGNHKLRVGAYGHFPVQYVFGGHKTFAATVGSQLIPDGGLPLDVQVSAAVATNKFVGVQVSSDLQRAGVKAYSVSGLYETLCCTWALGASYDSARRLGVFGWYRPFRHSKKYDVDLRFVMDFLQGSTAAVLAEYHFPRPSKCLFADAVGLKVDALSKNAALVLSKTYGPWFTQVSLTAPVSNLAKPQVGIRMTAA
jgi:hypothetical protein